MKGIAKRFDDARFFARIEMCEAHACMGNAMKNWEYTLLYWRWFVSILFKGYHDA